MEGLVILRDASVERKQRITILAAGAAEDAGLFPRSNTSAFMKYVRYESMETYSAV